MGWRWLNDAVVAAIHGEQIAEHGGGEGRRNGGLLSSALARPPHYAAYGDPSVFDLAAGYTFGIIQNHPFVDGNQRTGFLAAYVFLDLNGWELTAPEAEVVAVMLAMAGGEMDEAEFSIWLKDKSFIRLGLE
ncbi:MAG: type II toxin-antitoxin system death-on-curing family toxin [Deltaproteobacteria bacterium]|nr:type II toxin-antitoxin system death-on-curing family toxin [Deltaproteobacteria bacterium]